MVRPVIASRIHRSASWRPARAAAENQLAPLQEAAGRLGWTVVVVYRDEGISGATGGDRRTLSRLTTLTMPAVGMVRVGSPIIALRINGRYSEIPKSSRKTTEEEWSSVSRKPILIPASDLWGHR